MHFHSVQDFLKIPELPKVNFKSPDLLGVSGWLYPVEAAARLYMSLIPKCLLQWLI